MAIGRCSARADNAKKPPRLGSWGKPDRAATLPRNVREAGPVLAAARRWAATVRLRDES
jgi:hypothetical protein